MPTLRRTPEGVGDTKSVFGGQRWATIKEELRRGGVLVLQGPKKLSLEGVYLASTKPSLLLQGATSPARELPWGRQGLLGTLPLCRTQGDSRWETLTENWVFPAALKGNEVI